MHMKASRKGIQPTSGGIVMFKEDSDSIGCDEIHGVGEGIRNEEDWI